MFLWAAACTICTAPTAPSARRHCRPVTERPARLRRCRGEHGSVPSAVRRDAGALRHLAGTVHHLAGVVHDDTGALHRDISRWLLWRDSPFLFLFLSPVPVLENACAEYTLSVLYTVPDPTVRHAEVQSMRAQLSRRRHRCMAPTEEPERVRDALTHRARAW